MNDLAHGPRAVSPARSGAGDSAPYMLRLLGAAEVHVAGQVLDHWPSRAATCLLARLALQPERTHPREELIELLWPGVEPAAGRLRFRQALFTLRTLLRCDALGGLEPLHADRGTVRLVPGMLSCDAVQFERAVRAGDRARARALYRGELMPGHYDEWVHQERERLAALREALGPDADLPPPPPLAGEGVHRPTPGQAPTPPASALAPTAGSPPATPPAAGAWPASTSSALPAYWTQAFGQDEARLHLQGLVAAERLVLVIGSGGSGKTRLAIDTARGLGAAATAGGFQRVCFAPLVQGHSVEHLEQAVWAAAGLPPDGRGLDDALANAWGGGQRVLLILDNFEQMAAEAAERVGAWLAQLPGLHALLTSRMALPLAGACEFVMPRLAPPLTGPDGAPEPGNPAVALFVDRARRVRADFALGAKQAAAVAELVAALGGLPLAIELAASRVRTLSPAQLLDTLRGDGQPFLKTLRRSVASPGQATRHASIEQVVAWSWQLLDAPQRHALAALSVFDGPILLEAVAAVLGQPLVDAAGVLEELVAHSLLHPAGDVDGDVWWTLLPPIREYAASQCSPAQALAGRTALRLWLQAWVQTYPVDARSDTLRRQMPHVQAAMASAGADGAPDDAAALLVVLRPWLDEVSLPPAVLDLAEAALPRCANQSLRARGHGVLATACFSHGEPQRALRHAELGLALAGKAADARARALHAQARISLRLHGQPALVEPLLDEAEALLGTEGDAELRGSLKVLRAYIANHHRRDRATSDRLHAEALLLWQGLGNPRAVDTALYNLAISAQYGGRPAESLARIDPVIASARRLGDERRLNKSLNVRANALCGLRRWEDAARDYRACIRLAWSLSAMHDLAFGLWNLPRALAHLRQPEPAARLMGFAEHFWRNRFGAVSSEDQLDLRRIRRLAACQIGGERVALLWGEGSRLALAEAVALAVSRTDA